MKTNRILARNRLGSRWLLAWGFLAGATCAGGETAPKPEQAIDVAAYVWPSCQNDERARQAIWSEGIGEWEVIKKGTPRFEGHYQPRLPLWGYLMDDDPAAMERQIDAATDHGVNVFIYDWYWYDGKPFLEGALNNGFLKARNNHKMKFYLMWANHDVPGKMWNPYRYRDDTVLWRGTVDRANFEVIVARVIRQYFKQPNYYKIDGRPVFSLYDLKLFLESFPGTDEARRALDYFRAEVKKAGFPGLHLQVVGKYDAIIPHNPILCADAPPGTASIRDLIAQLGIDSVTLYNMAPRNPLEDYLVYGERGVALRKNWDDLIDVPFFPVVSVGWDTTPRFPQMGKESVVHLHSTPESFAAYLQKAREYVARHPEQPRLLIVNAWNEWVEGSYLAPDMKWGYGYLDAVKKVMSGRYDRYSPAPSR